MAFNCVPLSAPAAFPDRAKFAKSAKDAKEEIPPSSSLAARGDLGELGANQTRKNVECHLIRTPFPSPVGSHCLTK